MSGFVVRFVAVVCLLVFLSSQISANFWRPVSLPSNPKDPYYQAFQKVPSSSVTASKLMTNFLHIYPANVYNKRQSPPYVEDIVVVMDGSGSVGSCEFNKGKKALKYMMGLAAPGSDTKYAAVTFASSVRVNFKFLPYSTAANEIMKIPYPSGMTNTQAGLAKAKTLFDDPSSGRRVIARKMVFLVTDGQSNQKRHLTIPKAQALKNAGVQIYVVAVGTSINGIDEMVKVASYPPKHFLFRAKTLNGFWQIIKLVIKQVSPSKYAIVNGHYDPPCRWG